MLKSTMAITALATALVVATVATVGAGCQRKKKKKVERKTQVITRPPTPVKVLREVVHDAGAQPQALRRYRPSAAPRTSIAKRVVVTLSDRDHGEPERTLSLPPVTTTFAVGWLGGDRPRADVRAHPARIERSEDTSADALAAAEQLLVRHRQLLEGRAARVEVTTRGHLGAIEVIGRGGRASEREFLAALVDVVVPLPEVPIGVGATWEVTRAVPRGSSTIKQVSTYKLISATEHTLELEVTSRSIAEQQPLDAPVKPGNVAELLAMRAQASGTLTVDLRVPAAISGRVQRSDTAHVRVSSGAAIIQDHVSTSEGTVEISAARP